MTDISNVDCQPSQTAEAVAKGLHATIEFRMQCTVAKFNEVDKAREFVAWLKARHYRLIDSGEHSLCIAYTPPRIIKTKLFDEA